MVRSPMKREKLFSAAILIIGLLFPVFLCGQAWAVDVQISQLTDDPDPAIRGGIFPNFEGAETS